MQKSANYKVISRKKFAAIMVILLSIVAVGAWVSLDRLAEYRQELEELTVTEPIKAAATIKKLTRTLAVLNGIVLSSLALLIIWDGWRSWRSESIPPKGSWILEGQRIWTGESAVRIAKFKVAAGVLLGVLGAASSLILWGLGDTGNQQNSKGAYIHGHETNQFARRNGSNVSTRVAYITPATARFGLIADLLGDSGLMSGSGIRIDVPIGQLITIDQSPPQMSDSAIQTLSSALKRKLARAPM